jgi:hypothetical protein
MNFKMAKKKVIKIDTDNVDLNLEKDGTNIKIDLDTKNVDIHVIKDDLNKEFHYDGKKIDIDIKKTPEGIEVKVDATGALWKIIAKRIIKFVLKRFKR